MVTLKGSWPVHLHTHTHTHTQIGGMNPITRRGAKEAYLSHLFPLGEAPPSHRVMCLGGARVWLPPHRLRTHNRLKWDASAGEARETTQVQPSRRLGARNGLEPCMCQRERWEGDAEEARPCLSLPLPLLPTLVLGSWPDGVWDRNRTSTRTSGQRGDDQH